MDKEYILGRQPIYEVLRAERRRAFRLYILDANRSMNKEIEHCEQSDHKNRRDEIIKICHTKNIPLQTVPRSKLDSFGSGHQGMALLCSAYPYGDFAEIISNIKNDIKKEPAFYLILDTLQDPQNLGSLLRTAEAVGIHGVILPYRRTALVTPTVVHASSGACEHLFICQTNLAQAIEQLKKNNVWIIGLDSGINTTTFNHINLNLPLALVVGNEGQGLRPLVRNSCDFLLHLPMQGKIESLNAAAAGSIVLYSVYQKRKFLV